MNFKKRRIRNELKKLRNFEQKIEKENFENKKNFLFFLKTMVSNINRSKKQHAINTCENDKTEEFSLKKENENHEKKAKFIKKITLFVSIFVIIFLCLILFKLISSLDFSGLIFSFGKATKTDENGLTNILLVGKGGEGHDGADLTDTLILASLDSKKEKVKMLSIPRDFYYKDKETGEQRINKVYDSYINKYGKKIAREKLKMTITDITGINIHYIAIVDFKGFERIIDTLEGIEINVEKAIYDPYYPRGNTIYYEVFSIKAGLQKLDGATALKYARSRKTTSDFDRAKRQQQILSAAKDKALNLNILTNPNKIKKMYDILADNFETDISVTEVIELAKIGKNINNDNIFTLVLNDDYRACGGHLYTPSRDFFKGASVLLPADNGKELIRRFTANYLLTEMIENQEKIQILNGTRTGGLAGKYFGILNRECLNMIHLGNATNRDTEKSIIYYAPKEDGSLPASLSVIKTLIDTETMEGIPSEYLEDEKRAETQIVIVLGKDYYKVARPDPFDRLLYLKPPTPVKPETDENGEKEESTTNKTDIDSDME